MVNLQGVKALFFIVICSLIVGCNPFRKPNLHGKWRVEYVQYSDSLIPYPNFVSIIEITDSFVSTGGGHKARYSLDGRSLELVSGHLGRDTSHLEIQTLTKSHLVWRVMDSTNGVVHLKRENLVDQ